jgi:hypothetical protein
MTLAAPSRGDVWYADVPGDKRRPVLVMSRDPMGRLLHMSPRRDGGRGRLASLTRWRAACAPPSRRG